jgi:outer membrane exchange protein TraA
MDFPCSFGMSRVTIGAHAMSIRRVLLTVAALLTLSPTVAHAEPVVLGPPVFDKTLPKDMGTGLCELSAATLDVSKFDKTKAEFIGAINNFLEDPTSSTSTSVLRTIFDRSNNNSVGGKTISFGDFTDAMMGVCGTGGCPFFDNTSDVHFGSRLRGFLNVTEELAGRPIHIGVYADDAMSLTFFDKNFKAYDVIIREPVLGSPTWRLTNTITFPSQGLYPLEILYVEIAEHAAFELAWLDNPAFMDFELPVSQVGGINDLKINGFTLFKKGDFYETLNGIHPFPSEAQCAQCKRQFINQPGNNGCDPGYHCNEAALCAPCDSNQFCGPECSPCGGTTKFCVNVNGMNQCGACAVDSDCEAGFRCDPERHVCEECNDDSQCERGKVCREHSCVVCADSGQCAGTSCNCCPNGSDGQPMRCAALQDDGSPLCVECLENTDCTKGVCDKVIGRCVEALKKNSTPECCGDGCFNCSQDNLEFCLPGPLGTACAGCRSDMDCKDGLYCRSGECTACISDRRCGKRCTSCGGETPFCFGERDAEDAACVRCEKDEQCAGGKCNLATHECDKGCAMSCADETPVCNGQKCVECYADTQCPCGGTCDLDTFTCSSSCKTNGDCLGSDHCRWKNDTQKDCAPGPMYPVECSTGLDMVIGQATNALENEDPPEFCGFDSSSGSCAASGNDKESGLPSAGLLGLISMALLAMRRGRSKS